jgi:hypothetical protein
MMPKALLSFFAYSIVVTAQKDWYGKIVDTVLSREATDDSVRPEPVWYEIVVDAGSTGSRLYVMKFTMQNDGGSEVMKVETTNCGKKKPGLSSYVENPQNAVPPLLALFAEARKTVPKERWEDTKVKILGTAGMRSIKVDEQQIVWDGVKQGLVSADEYVFGKDSARLLMRTVSGLEEGTWVMLTSNFLAGKISHNLTLTSEGLKSGMIGVLDLGGSSTQIAVPPTLRSPGIPVVGEQGAGMVRSYAAFGMEQMRERIMQIVKRKGSMSSACDFPGYQDPHHGFWGRGNAQECRDMLQQAFASVKETCEVGDFECLPGALDASQAGSLGLEFFAVSGYKFVTDFVKHWSAHLEGDLKARLPDAEDRMTISELEAAADSLCTMVWQKFESATINGTDAGRHPFTDIQKAPHRCLEANYVATLLRMYGFPASERLVTFKDEVDGNDVEWPLGALLMMRLQKASPEKTGSNEEL